MSEALVQIEGTQPEEPDAYDWPELVDQLNRLLRLRTTPIGMKLFASVEEMEAVPRVRRPNSIHTTDQIVAQAARLGWTVGIIAEDLVGQQCGAVIGLHPQDEICPRPSRGLRGCPGTDSATRSRSTGFRTTPARAWA